MPKLKKISNATFWVIFNHCVLDNLHFGQKVDFYHIVKHGERYFVSCPSLPLLRLDVRRESVRFCLSALVSFIISCVGVEFMRDI